MSCASSDQTPDASALPARLRPSGPETSREQREDGGAPHLRHSVSASGTTTMRRAAMSISGTAASVNGTISGSPPPAA
jgi:hypothetical protein